MPFQLTSSLRSFRDEGFGPGGNLRHIAIHYRPRFIFGADISQTMYDIASRNLRSYANVELAKIDGSHLPFDSQSIDLSYTATVLQHVTDETMLKPLVSDVCGVTRDTIIIMEDIGHNDKPGEDWTGRTVESYRNLFAAHDFRLRDVQFLNTKISRSWYQLAWRFYSKFARDHHEGDRINSLGRFLIAAPIGITRVLDDIFIEDQSLAKLTFVKTT
jgi:Methyltransferase domain